MKLPEVPASQPVEGEDYQSLVKGLPLWAEVKQTFFRDWVEGNQFLKRIDNSRVQGAAAGDHYFRASVLALYRDLRDKVGNESYEKHDCVKRLKEMDLDQFLVEPKDFTLNKAITAFVLLRSFLEVNGITYYEDKQVDPEHAFMSEMQ